MKFKQYIENNAPGLNIITPIRHHQPLGSLSFLLFELFVIFRGLGEKVHIWFLWFLFLALHFQFLNLLLLLFLHENHSHDIILNVLLFLMRSSKFFLALDEFLETQVSSFAKSLLRGQRFLELKPVHIMHECLNKFLESEIFGLFRWSWIF